MEPHRDEHFEEVLGRLDSLIRRDQLATQPPPPPPVSEATIPVLTEVYAVTAAPLQPEVPLLTEMVSGQEVIEEISAADKLEQAVAAALPAMAEELEALLIMKIQPAMERALEQILEDLRPQIESILHQRLQALLAQETDRQTEM